MYRILIADDHPVVREGLKMILSDEFPGAHIEEAEETQGLVDKALGDTWDIVISDLAMPGGGGLEALKEIKKNKRELPVIIVSTYPPEQYATRVMKAGAAAYVSKDELPGALLVAVRAATNK